MTRDLAALREGTFDLVVVGGGIHGLFAAYDAAGRGLSVALVDRGDFGSGISFNHQRTIHGGLRALQGGNIFKCREHIAERRAWARIAPHLLRPLPFLIGTYRSSQRSRTAVRLGLRVYDALGRSRNKGVLPELHIPKGRLESAAAIRRLFPGVAERSLSGGAIWYDYQTLNPDRLTWTVALAAVQAGARLANYVEVLGGIRDADRVSGVNVRDALTGETFDIRTRSVLLAAGAGLARLQAAFSVTGAPPLLRAMNLLLRRPARDIAVAASSAKGRMYTAVPWRGQVLAGTWQSDALVASDAAPVTGDLIDAVLAEVNSAFPVLAATRTDVSFVHHGLVPAAVSKGGHDLLADPQVISHSGAEGLFSLVGVKYTTARLAAERAVNAVCRGAGRHTGRCRTAKALLPHADVADSDGMIQEQLRAFRWSLDRDVMAHLAGWYGTEAAAVLQCAKENNAMDRLAEGSPVLSGEVVYAVRYAAAQRLGDVVFRRTPLGSAGDPGEAAITRAAEFMAVACGWTDARRHEEMADVTSVFPRFSSPG